MNAYVDPQILIEKALSAFAPPPPLTVSDWSDEYRRLSVESSASPGRFRTSRVEYMREPMDMISNSRVRRVTLMTSAQVGKSTVIENVIGYFMHQDPCPILHVSPTLASMKMFSKERLAPMIRDTPVLRERVKESRARDSGNTLDSKTFPGGHIAMVGSNAPAGLASRPIRVLVCDEVDRFEASAGTEGDPINLAVKRTTTYWNRRLVFVSTPGNKGASRIEDEYLNGDQRKRWCPCPHCNEMQDLKWSQVQWDHDDPETALYYCEHCGAGWNDAQRNVAVRKGEWRASRPFNGNVSYHLSQLYSPFALLADGVRDFLDAKGNPEKLKTWVNTFLGETWEEKGQRLEWSDLMDRREAYNLRDGIPEEVSLITVGADTQDDRVEIEWVGWGDNMQSWSLGYRVIYGDPSTPEFWANVRDAMREVFMHPLFGQMIPRAIAIDSGGHYTDAVYKFAPTVPNCVAIKGVPGWDKPIVATAKQAKVSGVVNIGVDVVKEIVASRLRQSDPDVAGYCRFHESYEEPYFKGITAEELRTKYHKGFAKKEWHKVTNNARNEPFDCRVYATAALDMLGVDLNAHRRARLNELHKRDNETKEQKPKRTQKRGNWGTKFKHD